MTLGLQPPTWSFLPQVSDGPVRLTHHAPQPSLRSLRGTQLLGVGRADTPLDITGLERWFATPPDFDLAQDESGQLLLAIEQFGGGSNSLHIGTLQGSAFQETALFEGRYDYRRPRFLRGQFGADFVTVAAAKQLVLVARRGGPADNEEAMQGRWFRTLAPGAAGCAIAHAPVTPTSPMTVFYLDAEPQLGPFLRKASRRLLYVLNPRGERAAVLQDNIPVFTFDADAHGSDALLVLQSVDGPLALAIDLDTGTARPLATPPEWTSRERWIANPSVCATRGEDGRRQFLVAAEEGTGDSVLGIRTGTISLD